MSSGCHRNVNEMSLREPVWAVIFRFGGHGCRKERRWSRSWQGRTSKNLRLCQPDVNKMSAVCQSDVHGMSAICHRTAPRRSHLIGGNAPLTCRVIWPLWTSFPQKNPRDGMLRSISDRADVLDPPALEAFPTSTRRLLASPRLGSTHASSRNC